MSIVDEAGVAIRADFTKFSTDVTKGAKSASAEFARAFTPGPARDAAGRFLPTGADGDLAGRKTGQGFTTGMGRQLKSGISGLHDTVRKAVVGLAAGAAAVFTVEGVDEFLRSSTERVTQGNKLAAITAATIKATGGAAHVTASKVKELSEAIAAKTGVDAEQVHSSENTLLAFTKVRDGIGKNNSIFDKATKAVTDLSVATGRSSKAAALALGKALQDPVKQVTALTRVGVIFTKGQKDQIATMVKNGNTVGAQNLILNALSKRYGGVAAAAATNSKKLRVSFQGLQDAVGGILVPLLNKAAGAFAPFIAKAAAGVTSAGKLFSAFTGKGVAGINVDTLTGPIKAFAGVVQKAFTAALPGIQNLGTFLTGSLVPAFRNLLKVLGPLAAQLGSVIGPVVIGAFRVLASILANQVGPALVAVTGFLDANAKAVRLIVEVMLAAGAAFTAFSVISGIITAIAGATKLWAAAQAILDAALDANPITLIVIGLAALAAGLIYAYKNSATFRAIVLGALSGVETAFTAVVNAAKTVLKFLGDHWKLIAAIITGPIGAVVILVATHFHQIVAVIQDAVGAVEKVMGTIVNILTFPTRLGIALMLAVFFAGFNAIKGPVEAALNGIRAVISAVFGAFATIVRTQLTIILTLARAIWGAITVIFTTALSVLRAVVSAGWKAVTAVISTVGQGIATVARAVWDKVIAGAKAVLSGLDAVIGKPFRALVSAVAGFGTKLFSAAKGVFGQIKNAATGVVSDMSGIGIQIVDGLINGIAGLAGKLSGFITKFIDDNVPKPVRKLLDINSPSKVFVAIGASLVEGLTLGLKKSTGQLSAPLAALTRRLQAAGDSGLASAIKGQINSLNSLADQRIAVGKKLLAAQKSLADLQKQSKDFAAQAASNILATGDVTQFGSTFASIVTGFTASIAKAQAFAAAIKQLKGAGLNAASLAQIAAAGPASGLAAAQAILTSGGIGQINSLQKQLTTAANSVGSVTSSAMFSAGISAAQGLVAGLKSQQKSLTAQMRLMADSLVAEVNRKLGIHSPSTVFANVGRQIVDGTSLGIQSRQRSLDSLMRGLVTVPKGTGRPVATGPAPAAASSATRSNVPITALAIENFNAAPDTSPYRLAQELAFIARGGGLTPAGAR